MDAALHHTSGIFTWAAKWPTGPRNCHASHGRLIHGNLPNKGSKYNSQEKFSENHPSYGIVKSSRMAI